MKLYQFSSPATFYPLAGKLAPWFAVLAAVCTVAGLWIGFGIAPTDFQQGEAYRIIFIHVPTAWLSMFLYLVMGFCSIISLAFNTRLSAMMAQALAPTGALMTFIALWTGALWGRPTWGTYWAWDARMTSELILLFLYFGVMALRSAIDDARRADRACAVLTIVGSVNIPIIYYSVQWWNTLHQGASVSMTAAPKMASIMLLGMLVMSFAAWFYSIAVTLWRLRAIILERERGAAWVAALPELKGVRASEFLAMGGYGFYVWGSYVVTAVIVVAELLSLRGRRRAAALLAAGTPQNEGRS